MKELIDIYIEQGYPYDYQLNFDLYDGSDLEGDYNCYFYTKSIGIKQFSAVADIFNLTLTKEDTGKIVTNLESYVVYVIEKSTSEESKLVSGRIHIDNKVRN